MPFGFCSRPQRARLALRRRHPEANSSPTNLARYFGKQMFDIGS